MASIAEELLLENGTVKSLSLSNSKHSRSAHHISSSSLRKKSDLSFLSHVRYDSLRDLLVNLQQVMLGTKLFVLMLAIPFAIIARLQNFGHQWVFTLSLLGLVPLAERVSYLTEQIAFHTGRTVGGLLNATCGNATELIIAIFALLQQKVDVVKYSLLGSILSNLLLVLGTSLFCGGLANIKKEQKFDRKQADLNSLLLLLGLLCIALPLILRYAGESEMIADSTLLLSRISCIVMILAYAGYLVFQLWTHRQMYEAQEGEEVDDIEETPEIGFWSGFVWLIGMTILIALLSEYVVGTIEDVSSSWGLSVNFISVILLPMVGNAPEHAGAIIFALKNKLDISLGVALGSATQVAMFVVPLTSLAAWIIDLRMDLDFDILGTGSLALAIIITAFTLQDGTSHHMKGLVLLLCYLIIATCFFVYDDEPPRKFLSRLIKRKVDIFISWQPHHAMQTFETFYMNLRRIFRLNLQEANKKASS